MGSLSKGTKIMLGIFVVVIIIALVVIYIQSSASNDVNTWLCKLQTEWGIPKGSHFHFANIGSAAGTKFSCI